MESLKIICRDETYYLCINEDSEGLEIYDYIIAYEMTKSSKVNIYIKDKHLYKFVSKFDYNMFMKAVDACREKNKHLPIYVKEIGNH